MSRIDHYSFGRIVVDGSEHNRDVIILPERVVANWWRKDGHSLVMADLDDVLDELPQHLIVGRGAHGQLHPDPATIEQLEGRGMTVEVLKTTEAVERYEALDPKTTAAALHLTC
jgi:hypothetical protein